MRELPQHHRCSWSRRRLTEVALSDGALVGAGAGISAFLFGLAESPSIWHTAELDLDNAVFLRLTNAISEEGTEPAQPLLLPTIAKQFDVTERTLSFALREQLDIDLAPGRPSIVGRPTLAEHVIELHDDCFFRFKSQDPGGVEKVLSGVLALHGTYIRQEGISAVASDLLELLRSEGALRLKSDPRLGRVNLLSKKQTGLARRLWPWRPIGAIHKVGSTWQLVRDV